MDGRGILDAGPQQRLGILVIAENASFSEGGESYLAVQWFRGLLKEGVDAHLLVHARSKPELDQAFGAFSSRIHYVPEALLQTICWHLGKKLPTHVRDFTTGSAVHYITQFMQRRLARRLIAQYAIDVVHEPTPVAPRLPSMMHGLGVPVVMGPMNGNMRYPPAYRGRRSFAERAFVPVARAFVDIANFLMPGKRRADILLVANERTRSALPSGCTGKVRVLCENGVDPEVWRRPDDLPARRADSMSLVFLGRLVRWKGVDLVLDAFAEIRKTIPWADLHIIGDGPERRRLQAQADRLGLSDAVTFHGWLPPEQCPRQLGQSDILLFPSVFECGGAAVLEAMSLGLAVVALNWGGPSDYLAEGDGILVEPVDRRGTLAELVRAVLSLTPDKRRDLGEAAQRRIADHYTWPAKIRQIISVYRSACRQAEGAPATEELCPQ